MEQSVQIETLRRENEELRQRLAQMEEKENHLHRALDQVLAFSSRLVRTRDTERLYRECTAIGRSLLDLDFFSLMTLEEDRQVLVIRDAIGFPDSMVGTFSLVGGQGLSTWVVTHKTASTVLDFADEDRFEVPGVVPEHGITSAICVPMMIGEEVFGVLIGHSRSRRRFSSEDIALLQSFANQAAVSIRNSMQVDAIRNREILLETIIETIPHPVFHKNPDGVYLDCNRAFAEFLGLEKEQIIGATAHDIAPAELADIYQEADQQLLGGRVRQQSYETRVRYADGTLREVIFSKAVYRDAGSDRPGGVVGTMLDITDLRMAEKRLARRKAEFEAIFNAIKDAIIFVDMERRIIAVNPAFRDMFGYNLDEIAGRTTQLFYANPEEYHHQGKVRYNPDARPESMVYEMHYRRKNGEIFPAETMGGQVRDDEGRIIGYLGVIRDITERKKAEEAHLRLQQQMQHVQKLESLGVLAGGIAHDFNNLLMAILGNADLALVRMSPASPARPNLLAIEEASRRAADLCRQMLAYSGKGRFLIAALDLNVLVQEMANMLQISISKKAVLKFNLSDMVPPIEGDATQIRQVIMNLIINASEAIGDRSGIISIATGAMDCDRDYLVDTYLDENLQPGLYTYIEVADTGCGMDGETLMRLFDPFFTTKFTGRGLGMSAVLGIVRGHGGAIKVYSEPGRGTTIKVLFPVTEEAIPMAGCPNGSRVADCLSGAVILLVDDEETVRSVGRQMLELLGLKVMVAENGRQAVAVYGERKDEIDLVLLDLSMPHMDGVQAFRELRRLDRDVRVVMSSGYNEQEVTRQVVGKGLAGFIQKPYQIDTLRDVLAEVFMPGGEKDGS